jgi:hypothetical protein
MDVANVERIGIQILIQLHKTISRRYEIKPIDRVIKTTFSEKCGRRRRKTSTGEAKRVKMDGGL